MPRVPYCLLLFGSLAACAPCLAEDAAPPAVSFERDVRPIFRAHCFDCHGAEQELKGQLDLRLARFLLRGGGSGPAIVPGSPEESFLLKRVRAGEMPPTGTRLGDAELATLERWIAAGAPTTRAEPESLPPGLGITEEERAFWSFQPIQRPEVPARPAEDRARTPIDALLLAEMLPGLGFAPDADKLTLIKRASFDLVGLPPTEDQVARFMADESPEAYERMLDELLASPHYGERWARHWLDVAGYADSDGYTELDPERPWAWKYRDYVIRSLNADKPFDRFLLEQLAGDELAGPQAGDLTAEQIELLAATGFLRTAADGTAGGADTPDARNQVMSDTLRIVSTSLLGLSVACAQCHDHRYDPVPQADYYALRSVFEPALDTQVWQFPSQRQVSLYTAADRAKAAEVEAEAQAIAAERQEKETRFIAEALEQELLKIDEPLREQLRAALAAPAEQRTADQSDLLAKHPNLQISPGLLYQYNQAAADELKTYDTRINEVRAKKPVEEFVRVLAEPAGHAPLARLFYRGDHRQPQQEVPPGALTVLCPDGVRHEFPADDAELPTTGRRLAFARWLVGPENPLTARVLVNRVWMHHFGRGLVETPADFGRLGVRPTHPALLDWLADEWQQQGWSLKQLHKLILLSTAWRQSSRAAPEQAALDPENRYYGRKPLVRLEAEALRDRTLAVAGTLDQALFGAPTPLVEDETGQVTAGDSRRRSLYIQVRRSRPVALLTAFDAPAMEVNCERRPSSTVATQSLMLMNGDFVLRQAAELAARAVREAVSSVDPVLAADLPPLPPSVAPVWRYGHGRYDETTGRLATFSPLTHFVEGRWQGGPELPDAALGWVLVGAEGGHTGENPDHASVRRWVAPTSGELSIAGTLSHSNENGDGVRGRIVSSRGGLAGEWIAQNAPAATAVGPLAVEAGDTIDLVTDCRGDVNCDSYSWQVTLTLTRDGQTVAAWDSAAGFTGPAGPPLIAQVVRAWQLAYLRAPTRDEARLALDFLGRQIELLRSQGVALPENIAPERQAMISLCQALLSSNEFLYVD